MPFFGTLEQLASAQSLANSPQTLDFDLGNVADGVYAIVVFNSPTTVIAPFSVIDLDTGLTVNTVSGGLVGQVGLVLTIGIEPGARMAFINPPTTPAGPQSTGPVKPMPKRVRLQVGAGGIGIVSTLSLWGERL